MLHSAGYCGLCGMLNRQASISSLPPLHAVRTYSNYFALPSSKLWQGLINGPKSCLAHQTMSVMQFQCTVHAGLHTSSLGYASVVFMSDPTLHQGLVQGTQFLDTCVIKDLKAASDSSSVAGPSSRPIRNVWQVLTRQVM